MMDISDEAKARRAGRLKQQEQRAAEAEQIHSENAAKARAVDENTARLKAVRLAKEAADKEAAGKVAQAKPRSRRAASQPDGGHARQGPQERQPPLVANPGEVKGG
jgi:hypothetical protein